MGVLGGGAVLWAVVEAYRRDANFGTMLLVCGVGGAISCSWFSFQYLSKTKEGRKALLMDAEIKLPEDKYGDFLDKEGVALTDLRPIGIVKINDDRIDAATQGEYLEKGTKVIVYKLEADHVYVKELIEETKREQNS
jgi:membrane-bound serine protease (ClpP class)